jgi:GNAT superfamily N-acetyltransferase
MTTVVTNLLIRPASGSGSDYSALETLFNHAYPTGRVSAVDLKLLDRFRDPKLRCRRWVAELGGRVVGFGGFEHWKDYYHPHRYLLHLVVEPEYRRRGVGQALYTRVEDELSRLHPQLALAWVARESADDRRFAEKRGFVRTALRWNLWLDVRSCDLGPHAAHLGTLREGGIEVRPSAELAGEDEHARKLYDLYVETVKSINTVYDVPAPEFDEFRQSWTSSQTRLDYTLVATHCGRYVGMWALEPLLGGVLFGDVMGVVPEYRRRGVALGLMVGGITLAKRRGYTVLRGHTDEHNEAMLTITRRLGFTHLQTQVMYVKSY